jgi:transcription elongation factor Elf1
LGRRRRKKIKKMPRRSTLALKYFVCPICGQQTLTVDFKKSDKPGMKLAIVRCGTCKLYLTMEVPEVLDKVDVYNKVVDLVHEGKLEEYLRKSGEELAKEKSAEAITKEEGGG